MNLQKKEIATSILIFITYLISVNINPILGILLIPLFYIVIFDFKNIIKHSIAFVLGIAFLISSITLISISVVDDVEKIVLTLFTFESITFLSLIYIYQKKLKSDKKIFNFKMFLSNFKYWIIGFLLMAISLVIIELFIDTTTSVNQSLIEKLLYSSPVFISILIVIFAPIVEELIYRLTLRNIFKNPYAYIIISGFLFGLAHIADFSNLSELFFIIPYGLLGSALAYSYYKTDNILVPISLHFVHNSLSLLALILESVVK